MNDQQKLRKLQDIQLEILKETIKVFEKNGIRYVVSDGTMLGAVRHKGFIPWDDDVDLSIPRSDYEKFKKNHVSYLPENLFFHDKSTDKNLPVLFSKIRKNGTRMIEEAYDPRKVSHNGIWIDLFPIDGCGDNEKAAIAHTKKLIRCRKMINNSIYSTRFVTSGKKKRILQIAYRIVSVLIPLRLLEKKLDKLITKYSFENSTYVTNFSGAYGIKYVMKKEVYFDAKGHAGKYSFENMIVKGPIEYDLYLKKLYGNYMELPPLEKRTTGHNVSQINFQ